MHLIRKVPRIGIDCRFAHTHSGLGRYTRELVTHLLQRNDPVEYVLFVHSLDDEWLHTLENLPRPYLLSPSPYPHYSLSEQLLFSRIIKKAAIDLFFSPHFNVPILCPAPFVVTIHDLILHRYPNEAPMWKQMAYRLLMNHAIRKSSHIIAVSQYTASEICKTYSPPPLLNPLPPGEEVPDAGNTNQNPLPRRGYLPHRGRIKEGGVSRERGSEVQQPLQNKISVIHEGVSSVFFPRSKEEQMHVLKKYRIQSPFFLYVGNNKEHKNVEMLKNAAQQAGIFLVCVPETTGNISDTDLSALYSAARCFVSASLYEGFCLPAVEAIACGCPVIAPECAAIPEVVGTHGVLIEPQFDALVHALRTPPQRGSASRLYDWDKTAELTAETLKSALCAVSCYH